MSLITTSPVPFVAKVKLPFDASDVTDVIPVKSLFKLNVIESTPTTVVLEMFVPPNNCRVSAEPPNETTEESSPAILIVEADVAST